MSALRHAARMTSTPLGHSIVAPRDFVAGAALPLSVREAKHAGWLTPTCIALAALALGLALEVNLGQYHRAAMPWLTLSLVACVAASVTPNVGRLTLAGWRPDQLVLAIALTVQFALLYVRDPAVTLKITGPDDLAPFKAGVALAAALVAVGVSATRAARLAVPMLLLAHLALGVWIIRATPAPGIDVYVFQHDACDALLNGVNPYAITFPDVYHGKLPVYAPGLAENGRLNFGYPYLPLTLLLALPGHLLGDFRYAQLLAMTLAGALLAYARRGGGGDDKVTIGQGDKVMEAEPSRLVTPSPCHHVSSPPPAARSVAAAAMLLFTPRGFFVLEAGWTEPFVILLLTATVFAACRRGTVWGVASAIAFGLMLASKQYMILALPLVLLLPIPRKAGRLAAFVIIAIVVAAAVTLPMALWDVKAFIHSAVTLQFQQPFRADALSYLVPLRAGGTTAVAWTSFACAAVAGLLALWRCPRTPAGFAIAFALVFFAFFATSKQAFCNYYALVLAAMCCALAATPGVPRLRPVKP